MKGLRKWKDAEHLFVYVIQTVHSIPGCAQGRIWLTMRTACLPQQLQQMQINEVHLISTYFATHWRCFAGCQLHYSLVAGDSACLISSQTSAMWNITLETPTSTFRKRPFPPLILPSTHTNTEPEFTHRFRRISGGFDAPPQNRLAVYTSGKTGRLTPRAQGVLPYTSSVCTS